MGSLDEVQSTAGGADPSTDGRGRHPGSAQDPSAAEAFQGLQGEGGQLQLGPSQREEEEEEGQRRMERVDARHLRYLNKCCCADFKALNLIGL